MVAAVIACRASPSAAATRCSRRSSSRVPTVAPGVPRRLPDEEQHHAVRRRRCCCSIRSAATPTHAAARRAPGDALAASARERSGWRSGSRARATSSGSSSSSGCRCSPGARCAAARCSRRELREKAEQAERDRVERRSARSRRSACASPSELQELVANGLSAMVVQAEAVPRAVEAGDTARAGGGARRGRGRRGARRSPRCARCSACSGARATAPSSRRSLASRASRRWWSAPASAGSTSSLGVDGGRRALPPGVDLTAYRVVEDALDGRGGQARGRADGAACATGPRAAAAGHRRPRGGDSAASPGLRERVGLYGGHLRAARDDGGGFRVRATCRSRRRR